ncbi:unnamed protein product [Periconia digitata]|uniref:Secreted protein n=1 Tax=Periconia digitata TaxID=1303443 RepID=A0A9W4UID7_9PLEO|nr:unnamed protein product [Periconia digitata]
MFNSLGELFGTAYFLVQLLCQLFKCGNTSTANQKRQNLLKCPFHSTIEVNGSSRSYNMCSLSSR